MKKRGKTKRGSHVGTVLSFVIFVTFLVFLYSVIEPAIKTQGDKQFLLDYLETKLTEKCSANLIRVTITNSSNPTGYDCLKVDNTELEVLGLDSIVKDENNNFINSNSLNGFLKIAWTGETFFKVYYSEESFKDFPTSNNNCADSIIESVRTKEYIFETKVIKLKEEYESDYENLKDELKIPDGSEFSFSFTYSNGTIIGIGEKEVSTSVYAKKIPIQYIDEEANVLLGFITIKVW